MKFRDRTIEIPKPFHNGKQWVYEDTPTYDNMQSHECMNLFYLT